MYQKHEMKVTLFEYDDVFAVNESGTIGSGEVNPWSINPDRSDG